MRAGASFSLVNNETGERLGGVQECNINLSVDRYAPLVTLKFIPEMMSLDIKLTDLTLSVEEPKSEQVTVVEEFKLES